MKYLASLIFCFFVSSCVFQIPVSSYKEPKLEREGVTTVSFVMAGERDDFFGGFSQCVNERCLHKEKIAIASLLDDERFKTAAFYFKGLRRLSRNSPLKVKVESERNFVITASASRFNVSCSNTIKFMPHSWEEYEVVYTDHFDSCTLEAFVVSDVIGSKRHLVPDLCYPSNINSCAK